MKKLELEIRHQYSVEGIKEVFPHLEELIIDDSDEDLRVHYDLSELKVQSLDLRLSCQWMNESDESFGEMIAKLKKQQWPKKFWREQKRVV